MKLAYYKINLSKKIVSLIEDLDMEDVVITIYKGNPLPGIYCDQYEKIRAALIESGFLPELPFGKNGDTDFLCKILGMSPRELYEKYDIIDCCNPARGVLPFLKDVFPYAGFLDCDIREYYTKQRMQRLFEILDILSARELTIIKMYFGFDGEGAKSLEKTGEAFGISRERTRQIKANALEKLRQPNCSKQLIAWFLDSPAINSIHIVDARIRSLKSEAQKIEQEISELMQNFVYQEYTQLTNWRNGVIDHSELEKFSFSARTLNCLNRAGINTISKLSMLTDGDLRKVNYLGEKGIVEIREKIPAPKF